MSRHVQTSRLIQTMDSLTQSSCELVGARSGLLVIGQGPHLGIAGEHNVDSKLAEALLPFLPTPESLDKADDSLQSIVITEDDLPRHLSDSLVKNSRLTFFPVPIVSGSQSIGVLFLFGVKQDNPKELINISKALSHQIGAFLDYAQHAELVQEQKEQLDAILHYSADGILTVDSELLIAEFNPAMEKLTGWSAKEVLGKFYFDVLKQMDSKGKLISLDACPLMQAFSRQDPVIDRQMIIQTRDGEQVYVGITAAAVYSPNGEPYSGVMNIRDVTRKQEDEELRATFISVVSHELQTPIAIIKGYSSTLSRADVKWDQQVIRKRLEAIEEESDRLNKMVTNLLYASRIQAGAIKMDLAPLDLPSVVKKLVEKIAAKSPDYQFKIRFPANFPVVQADRDRIEEVLMNLLDNAVKYSPDKKVVRVEGQVTGDEIIIGIADNGIGVSLRERDRIFDRFHRVNNKSSRSTQGAGLGLFICRAIIEAHEGRIWVESEFGKGSIFYFSLPREERAQLPMLVFRQPKAITLTKN